MSSDEAPEDERHRPFWEAARSSHPRLHRMTDILGDSFAVILLSQAELNGPLCRPADTRVARALSSHAAPRWLEVGSGRALFDGQLGTAFDRKAEDLSLYKMFGTVPEARLDWSRALQWRPRENDPNAGKAPEDPFSREKASGYQPPHYYEGGVVKAGNYRKHSWTADHALNHIGGTMQPIQSTPKFRPFYVEFEEYLGGYNFGTGNCQLDFLNMQLDWACG